MKAARGKYAGTATVGEKGQIVIPKRSCELFEIRPGETLLLPGGVKRGIAIPPKGTFVDLFSMDFEEKGW